MLKSSIKLSEYEVNKISFDDIIDNIGGFGSWQMIIFFMISSFDVFAAFSLMLPVFTGKTLDLCFKILKHSVDLIRLLHDCISYGRQDKVSF